MKLELAEFLFNADSQFGNRSIDFELTRLCCGLALLESFQDSVNFVMICFTRFGQIREIRFTQICRQCPGFATGRVEKVISFNQQDFIWKWKFTWRLHRCTPMDKPARQLRYPQSSREQFDHRNEIVGQPRQNMFEFGNFA
ncbi:hypothetical protein EAG14_14460 [Acidovorax sp. 1608163]|nr:hypothetical protein EAG14_14460 [Acidovorax sp. 1608163]